MRTLLIVTLLAAGCASRKPATPPGLRPLVPEPQAGLRLPEVVQSYHLGRHIDPAHPDLMSEAHPVYRIEADATWDLRPGAQPWAVMGPDPAHAPAPLNDAITAELNRQKDATERVMREASRLAGSFGELQGLLADLTRVARDHSELARQLRAAEERQARFEKDLERLQGPAPGLAPLSPPPE